MNGRDENSSLPSDICRSKASNVRPKAWLSGLMSEQIKVTLVLMN